MSQDVELIINNTSVLFFEEKPKNSLTQNYRLLDAPVTRYLIGIFRNIFNVEALHSDWDWAKTWNENRNAIPSEILVLTARLSAAIFFPFSIILFALIIKEVFSRDTLFIFFSVCMFSLNSLFLLHTRRAMAESGMIFFMLLSLFMILKIEKRYFFLVSIPITFAINTKQSLIFLIPIAIFMIIYYYKKQWKQLALQLGLFLVILISIFYAFNPIMWKDPVKVGIQMMNRRNELSQNQESSIESVTPDFLTNSASKKITALIAQVFILQPSPQEIGNYQNDLNLSIIAYFNHPIHKGLLRNLLGGTIYLLLFVFGFFKSFKLLNSKLKLILMSGLILFLLEIILLLKFPFQRYYLPAIPFTIIFAMIGLSQIIMNLKNSFSKIEVN